ncbi:MAG: dihydrolipoyl dehydrogenase [Candidatus Delongbacteria bacterium]|nr:dihydrolipoyl dehydrogenase [Candidatus Delongbacteria bacterium]MBN2834882.1 dihydrolipoyl dehydrogenase [Candidatus Delongbacteria bacterium]
MDYDIVVIGAGPAGYVAAIRAGQLGLKTAIIEKNVVGGMCLNWGCIPTKSIIESAKLYKRIIEDAGKFGIDGIDKKEVSFNWEKAKKRALSNVTKLTKGVGFLLKKNNVEIIEGAAKITGKNTISVSNRTIETKNIIIATGSFQEKIDIHLPDNVQVHLNKLYDHDTLPENITVVGKSSVAVELAQFFSTIGKKVNLIVDGERIMPFADTYLSDWMFKKLKKDKVNVINDAKIEGYEDGSLIVNGEKIVSDIVVNAKMRKGIMPPSELDLGVENGFIKVDSNFMTRIDGIYAIGDVNGLSYLAQVASAQGLNVVNNINGIKEKLDIKKIPLNMYSIPEVAQIGYTEQELKDDNIDYKISEFPMSANGKALAEGHNEGFVRILSEKKYGEVVGVQIVAPNATDLIAEAAALMQIEGTVYDLAKTVHAHPTVSEIFMEAGFEAVDHAIHK